MERPSDNANRHQYEPHDAPDPMRRDFDILTVATICCAIGAGVLMAGTCVLLGHLSAWVMAWAVSE